MHIKSIMKQFMEPKSVAIAGASRQTGAGSNNILENMLGYGYKGKLYPINPNAQEILGIKAYPGVNDLEDPVDLMVIATPRSQVPAIAKQCADKGIRCACIVAQGFSDASDDEGKRLHKEVDDIVKNSQLRILGPNTFGTANAFLNFSSSYARVRMIKSPTAVICQTGVFFVGFPELSLLGKGVDLGDAMDIDFADSLEYFEDDAQIKVVALHIEGMTDAKRFISAAKRVAQNKPVVAFKTGKSEQAARAAQSHTGSLTGKNEMWDAAFKQAGVIRAVDLGELIDLTRMFAIFTSMKTPKIGVATVSGGLGIAAIDACQNSRVAIEKLSPRTKKVLDPLFPPFLHASNPVDIWPVMIEHQPPTKPLRLCLETLLSDPQLGGVLFLSPIFDKKWLADYSELLNEIAAHHPCKPFVCALWGPYGDTAIKRLQDQGRIVAFSTPERAIRALSRLAEYVQLH